jgi:UDP-N-acetylglucosamine 2-epimerase (non-hydrolysing)
MVDSLLESRRDVDIQKVLEARQLDPGFVLVTLHRPSNVDQKDKLGELVAALVKLSNDLRIVFAIHPRTRRRLEEFGLLADITATPRILATEPLGYIEFMSLVSRCTIAVTDSGGLQEETTYLGIPCITLRDNTERPVTVTEGTNRLLKAGQLVDSVRSALQGKWPKGRRPDRWDGKAASRASASLKAWLDKHKHTTN